MFSFQINTITIFRKNDKMNEKNFKDKLFMKEMSSEIIAENLVYTEEPEHVRFSF